MNKPIPLGRSSWLELYQAIQNSDYKDRKGIKFVEYIGTNIEDTRIITMSTNEVAKNALDELIPRLPTANDYEIFRKMSHYAPWGLADGMENLKDKLFWFYRQENKTS